MDEKDQTDPRSPLRELFHKAKQLFDYVAPREYGISDQEKLEIGVLTSRLLLRQLMRDLEAARTSSKPCCRLYFTKESHVHALHNVIRLCLPPGIPEITELDYL